MLIVHGFTVYTRGREFQIKLSHFFLKKFFKMAYKLYLYKASQNNILIFNIIVHKVFISL